jgi:hypothetical protein
VPTRLARHLGAPGAQKTCATESERRRAVRSVKILAGRRIGGAAGVRNSPPDLLEEAICGELIASAQRPAELPER